MPDPRCSICSNAAALALVDGALLSGEKPSAVWNAYGESLQVSRSATFRHAAHRQVPASLDVQYVGGDTTVGDVVSGLASLRRSLIEQRADALSRGQHAVANSTAQRIESTSVALIREAGISDESQAYQLAQLEHLRWLIGRSIWNRPDIAAELAATAEELGHSDLAADLLATGERGRTHLDSTMKETE